MTERIPGLRFDIYERVHLPEHTVGIKELDEVELVPHIQLFTEGEKAILKGNLYLTGKYQGETGGESRTLEHYIPVEIELPLNRIQQLEDVGVDIDNFDIDLLNPRSLNVTGVLTLQGVETISPADDSWQEEEETIFVHEAARSSLDEDIRIQQAEEENRKPPKSKNAAQPSNVSLQSPESESNEPDTIEFFGNAEEADELKDLFANESFAEQPSETPEAPAAQEAAEALEEPKEPKIAFGSQKAEDTPYHLKSLLHNGDIRPSSSLNESQKTTEASAVQEGKSNAVEWKRLFAGDDDNSRQFSRLRAYIVQKEDSLEKIAQRYSIQPREILLRNGLSDQELSEGQVIYIPKQ